MALELRWMRPDAPYMPITVLGLLAVVPEARASWNDGILTVETDIDAGALAARLLDAPLPDLNAVPWTKTAGQSLNTALEGEGDPLLAYLSLCAAVAGEVEEAMLRAVATDQARRAPAGAPARSRLLVGAKADLSPFRWRPKPDRGALARELSQGPEFVGTDSGPCLGLVPEVHTFGGTVGRTASTIGATSPLLALLLRHGLLALSPSAPDGAGPRLAGGALLSDAGELSWCIWTFSAGAAHLRALFAWEGIHRETPDRERLHARCVESVYRSTTVKLSDTVNVFRWGRRVA